MRNRLTGDQIKDLFDNIKHGDKDHQWWLYAALTTWAAGGLIPSYIAGEGKTIPMRLPCPSCNVLHIDEGEFATKVHHTHACQHCGMVWRPAVVPTVGVQFLPGFKNAD